MVIQWAQASDKDQQYKSFSHSIRGRELRVSSFNEYFNEALIGLLNSIHRDCESIVLFSLLICS